MDRPQNNRTDKDDHKGHSNGKPRIQNKKCVRTLL